MYILLSNIIANAGEVGTKGTLPCTAVQTIPSNMEINMEVSQNPQAAFLDDPAMLLLSTDPQESKLTSKRYLHINAF